MQPYEHDFERFDRALTERRRHRRGSQDSFSSIGSGSASSLYDRPRFRSPDDSLRLVPSRADSAGEVSFSENPPSVHEVEARSEQLREPGDLTKQRKTFIDYWARAVAKHGPQLEEYVRKKNASEDPRKFGMLLILIATTAMNLHCFGDVALSSIYI